MTAGDWWLLAAAVLLIGISGLLVSAETALLRVSRSRVEELRRDDVPRAARLLRLLDDRPRYVNVVLFLSTLAAVTATVLITVVVGAVIDGPMWVTVIVVVAVMVVVSYIGLGVAPRTLGRQHAERIALRSAGFAAFVAALLGPLTRLLIVIGNALTPGKGYREGPFASQAELRELVDLAGADALIEDEERQMIHSVFELGDTIAREVMVPRTELVFIESDRTLRQALSLCLRSGFSRVPVVGDGADDIRGVIYLKDVMRRVFDRREAESSAVETLMRPAYFVPDTKQADELLRDMQAARVHIAIVVDEYGGTAGLVTIEDILEEIVGEIDDEYDTAAPEVAPLQDGAYRVSSRMDVDDFADLVGLDVVGEDEGVETVLGLMAKRLGRVPIPGATIEIDGWVLVAEQGAGRRNRIGSVLAAPRAGDADEAGGDDEPGGDDTAAVTDADGGGR
jgi:CBS domain containing-hemolysin-like protein